MRLELCNATIIMPGVIVNSRIYAYVMIINYQPCVHHEKVLLMIWKQNCKSPEASQATPEYSRMSYGSDSQELP